MARIEIREPRPGAGPRVLLGIAGSDVSLTISEATDLHSRLGEALLVAAAKHGERLGLDPRINACRYTDDEHKPVPR